MRNALKTIVACMTVCCGVLLIIHRNVIAACVTGSPMPEAPEWHKKLFGLCKKEN